MGTVGTAATRKPEKIKDTIPSASRRGALRPSFGRYLSRRIGARSGRNWEKMA